MTKEEYLEQMEGPCILAAQERPSNILDQAALRKVYRAIALKLLEGLEEQICRFCGFSKAWRLTLPKEPSDG